MYKNKKYTYFILLVKAIIHIKHIKMHNYERKKKTIFSI